jgi:hypothetical protein
VRREERERGPVSLDSLRRYEEGGTNLTLPEQTEELSTGDKVHDHVQVLRVGERAPEVDEEGMTDPDEHLSLRVCVLDLLHPDDFLLAEDFDGIVARVVPGLDEVDSTEGPGTESRNQGRKIGGRVEEHRRGEETRQLWRLFQKSIRLRRAMEG